MLVLLAAFAAYINRGGGVRLNPTSAFVALRDVTARTHFSRAGEASSGHGYIMALSSPGQLGANVNALLSMQCWAASYNLPVFIVELFADSTRHKLRMSKKARSGNITNLMRFSDLFDVEHFNQISFKNGSPPFVSWEKFIQNAPRNVILANINMKCRAGEQQPEFHVTKEAEDDPLNDKWLQNDPQLREAGFHIVRIVSFTMSCQFTRLQLEQFHKNVFQEWNPQTVTVIFNNWRGGWTGLHNPDGTIQCEDPTAAKYESLLRPSPRLLKDAQRYTKMFLSGGNKVAVMVRTEHAILALRHYTKTTNQSEAIRFEECLQKAVELGRGLGHKTESHNTMFLTLDVGKYGSIVMQEGMHARSKEFTMYVDEVKSTVPALYEGKWTFEEWENSFVEAASGIEDTNYIASLQRTIASQADCLVLMGGGTYQRLAYAAYRVIHPDVSNQCVHFLCFGNSQSVEFGLKGP